jgi:heme exporter protein CcmD
MIEWFAMHGYAKFVWPAVAITLFALAFNALRARSLLRRARDAARRRLASEPVSS